MATLPSSGRLDLPNIQQVMGGPTTPARLSNYARGGVYVPNIAANSSIVTSGQLKMSQFAGASNGLTFGSRTITTAAVNGFVGWSLNTDGSARSNEGIGGAFYPGEWWQEEPDGGIAAQYDARHVETGGTVSLFNPLTPNGVWSRIDTGNQVFNIIQFAVGASYVGNVEFRKTGTTQVLHTAVITLGFT